MQIQRYLLKNKEQADYFGEHFRESSWDFEWFIGLNKIGIVGNPSTEAECFMAGFLVGDERLLITPSKESPKIKRGDIPYARMSGHDSDIRNVYDLIELIQSQETTHAYIASDNPEKYGERILAFSTTAPSKERYQIGKVMPVVIDEEALRDEIRYKEERKLMEERIARIKERLLIPNKR